ncbi:DUF1642 domain-containing protein [Streptococcus gordonii]|uniref:DUF1642 domain-containing protein n=1 Tax=Streptococcus gordonii TaxID=1302 RepID=UPI0022848100|nr:DUF1642 domain-containing protein [Streptococcus gordonii]MCY7133653.1 DUF1642 domain-containing protein [Streptococcus gordonii]
MSKKELVKALMERMQNFGYFPSFTNVKIFIKEYEKLAKPEPQAGHADEAPLYLRNVISRLRELPLHDREVWLKAIMDEFEEDFCHSIWREGYEQGKFEGEWVGNQLKDADKIRQELNKPVIPQFVADWIEYCKFTHVDLQYALIVDDVYFYNYANQKDFSKLKEFLDTENNPELFARAWLDGYEVEKEKRYTVKIKTYLGQFLGRYYLNDEELTPQFTRSQLTGKGELPTFTRQELEETGFGWAFDCEGIEVEEVEE